MISFCITCKNRSKIKYKNRILELFPKCLASILECCNDLEEKVEVIISDWNSTDYPLNDWVYDVFKGSNIDIKVVQVIDETVFNLAHGRNVAFNESKGDKIFFMDADMILCKEVILDSIKNINEGYAVFPICYFEKGAKQNRKNMFGDTSYGNMFISRKKFKSIGYWKGTSLYGSEDISYYQVCFDRYEPIARKRYANFKHQWHPRYIGWPKGKKRNPKKRIYETKRGAAKKTD